MTDHAPETPLERAWKDIVAAAVCLEETQQTLKAGAHTELAERAAKLRAEALALAENVRDA